RERIGSAIIFTFLGGG
ncbi:unnamed protein product, partial [Allacma fusca]